jgi:hypothetical protein
VNLDFGSSRLSTSLCTRYEPPLLRATFYSVDVSTVLLCALSFCERLVKGVGKATNRTLIARVNLVSMMCGSSVACSGLVEDRATCLHRHLDGSGQQWVLSICDFLDKR